MITITHLKHGDVQFARCHIPKAELYWRSAHRYAVGWDEPKYPMPALPRSTTINPWSVTTFEVRDMYDYTNRVWDFDSNTTACLQFYRERET